MRFIDWLLRRGTRRPGSRQVRREAAAIRAKTAAARRQLDDTDAMLNRRLP